LRPIAVVLLGASLLGSCVEEHPDWVGASGDTSGTSNESSDTNEASTDSESSEASSSGGDGDSADTTGETGPLPDEHLIFATTAMLDGAFGGLEAADLICQMHATAGGLEGNYKALLSDDDNSAASRLTIAGPVFNMAAELVAADADELWSGTLTTPVTYTETGAASMGPLWTGSTTSGVSNTTCENWTSNDNAVFGSQGFRTNADFAWIDAGDDRCFKAKSLYCISQ
jgi:hypothetical protein